MKLTKHQLIIQLSQAIKRAEGSTRALVHYQRNFAWKAQADVLALSLKMLLGEAAADAAQETMKIEQAKKLLKMDIE